MELQISDKEQTLWNGYKSDQSDESRNSLFEFYSEWIRSIAKKAFYLYPNPMIEFGDYVHTASITAIECFQSYDPERGVPFEAYAKSRVLGSVINFVNKSGSVKGGVSSLQSKRIREHFYNEFLGGDAQAPSFESLVDYTINVALGYLIGESADVNRNESYHTEDYLLSKRLSFAYDGLNKQQKFVVKSYYQQFLSFAEISDLLSVSAARVSQIHKEALESLRQRMKVGN
jgi:RNA polymerase sigma factor for flagellar operon FliA